MATRLAGLFTSHRGRIGRAGYWAGFFIILFVQAVAYLAIGAVFDLMSTGWFVAFFVVQLILVYPGYAVLAKRLQDRDKPAGYAIILLGLWMLGAVLGMFGVTYDGPFQPTAIGWMIGIAETIVFVWFLIELGLMRGTVGSNQYGEDPVARR